MACMAFKACSSRASSCHAVRCERVLSTAASSVVESDGGSLFSAAHGSESDGQIAVDDGNIAGSRRSCAEQAAHD